MSARSQWRKPSNDVFRFCVARLMAGVVFRFMCRVPVRVHVQQTRAGVKRRREVMPVLLKRKRGAGMPLRFIHRVRAFLEGHVGKSREACVFHESCILAPELSRQRYSHVGVTTNRAPLSKATLP